MKVNVRVLRIVIAGVAGAVLFLTAVLTTACGAPEETPRATSQQATQETTVEPAALLQALAGEEDVLVLDVRTEAEYQGGHVPGAVNIPHDQLASRIEEVRGVEADRIVVYCESGRRAAMAQETLRTAGVANIQHLEGDMPGWRDGNLPQVKPQEPMQ
jgi:rhodanese-related sulfurtransferase